MILHTYMKNTFLLLMVIGVFISCNKDTFSVDANLDNSDQRDFNLEINNIKNNSKKELKKYLNEIEQNTIQKNKLIKSLDDANSKIKNLKQKYKENVSKNAKLNSQKNDLETEIKELKLLIEEQNLFIKVLKDTTHHG